MADDGVLPPRFELIREVGAGGMGVVYEAHDQVLGRTVAVKVFHDRSPETIDRVKQEFRVAAAVRHPNLVRLGELFEHDGSLCFSMELVHGVGLSTWVRAGDHHARVRAAIGQVAGALAALHRAGVVHRDVKPSNVVVTPDERVVLLDLGLAATIGGKALEVAGTVEYVAPRVAAAAAPTPAIDLYALGVTGFELLTGRTPFDGTPAEILVAKCEREPPATTGVAGVPAALDATIVAMLAREPSARPAARDVEAQLADAPTPARRRRRITTRHRELIGRADELATLLAATEELSGADRTTLFLVRGAAGVGKTALLSAFATAAAARGHVVAMGRCSAREHLRYNAWDALIDELARYLMRLPAEARAAIVPERRGAGLAVPVVRPSRWRRSPAPSRSTVVADASRRCGRSCAASPAPTAGVDPHAHGATDDSLSVVDAGAPSPLCVVVLVCTASAGVGADLLEQLRKSTICALTSAGA
jgi:predicted Ser/Thr protein kinase